MSSIGTSPPTCSITRILPEFDHLLGNEAQEFLIRLHCQFEPQRQTLLNARQMRQKAYDQGNLPDFLEDTRSIRESDWHVADIPDEILNRRVEITGPVDRKMIINALNSDAQVYMADLEDSHAPTWQATLDGQRNLIDAVSGEMEYLSPTGKTYRLDNASTVLMVRPRGWHLSEKHFLVDGIPMSASLFDFGLNFFHTARTLQQAGKTSFYYLPKMEHYLESRLWNDVFAFSEAALGLNQGAIRATALIETLPAVFQMHEILYEARSYLTGLNCGRWDYIFSYIKTFREHADRVLPDRADISMDKPFLTNYSRLLIETCHRRGAFAIGGMAAQIPIKDDTDQNRQAIEKVQKDKLREVVAGHDGTWVAHPGLIPIALQIFNEHMPGNNQIDKPLVDINISRDDLILPCEGQITASGLKDDIEISIIYIAAWISGKGCLPIHHMMEDAATAEIARSLVWHWLHHHMTTREGKAITHDSVSAVIQTVLDELLADKNQSLTDDLYIQAAKLFSDLVSADQLADFLTLATYEYYD